MLCKIYKKSHRFECRNPDRCNLGKIYRFFFFLSPPFVSPYPIVTAMPIMIVNMIMIVIMIMIMILIMIMIMRHRLHKVA